MAGKISDLAAGDLALSTDYVEFLDVSDTSMAATGTNKKLTPERLLGLAGVLPGGRLTLTTGVSATTSDVTAAGTIYYTPHVSDYVRLYDGTRVKEYVFTDRSLALSSLTSGKNYDVWLYDSSGTLTLELLVWTDDTTRATALAWQSGLGWTKSGDATRLYLGTIRTTGTTTTEDSAAKRFVWNAYNQKSRTLVRQDPANSWTYTTDAWRQAGGNSANQVEVVLGLAGEAVRLVAKSMAENSAGVANIASGVGVSSTTVNSAQIFGQNTNAANVSMAGDSFYEGCPGVGYFYLAWLERTLAFSGGTTTWYGDANLPTNYQFGLCGEVWA